MSTTYSTLQRRLAALLAMLLAVLLLPAGLLQARGPAQAIAAIEIAYRAPGAATVLIVWGVDGWQPIEAALRPAGTTVESETMRTPMQRQGERFSATLRVPQGARLDYGFLITYASAGEPVWEDKAGEGYHAEASADQAVELEAPPVAKPEPAAEPAADEPDPNAPPVTQELRYSNPDAGEVFLLWGINGWQALPEADRPAGTVIDDEVMSTPMQASGEQFTVDLRVPDGAKIDYGFLITKKRTGADVRVWEADGERNFAARAAAGSPIEHRSTLSLAGERVTPREFDLGLPILIGLLALALGAAVFARWRGLRTSPALLIISTAIAFWLITLPMRANILNFGWISAEYSLPLIPATIWAGYYDMLYIGATALLFLGLAWLLRRRPSAARAVAWVYAGLALLSLLMAIANTKVVALLGRPFNYQWFYYSDFLGSTEAQSSIMSNVSSALLLNMAILSAVLIGLALALSAGAGWLLQRAQPRRYASAALVGVLAAYLPLANWQIGQSSWEHGRLVNPIAEFVNSIAGSQATPGFFTMQLPAGSQDEFTAPRPAPSLPAIQPKGGQPVRNVVLFVMESTAAEYIGAYGGKYPVTPVLDRYRDQSLIYKQIYAHAPASNQSLVSMLGSVYPWISYRSLTKEHPDVAMPTLSSVLGQQGYRTAFFSAADIRFQNGDQFLAARDFDTVADFRSPECSRRQFIVDPSKGWSHLDGANEECLPTSFDQWLGDDTTTPFFTMMWTVQTHYPYVVDGEETDYGVNDKTLNTYLNALKHSDMVLGQLLDTLERRGLSDSTLVVVVGDHGEAFGRHNQRGHGGNLYEENIHVPLFFIQPRLFDGAEKDDVGGLVDVAPTIMHLIGQPAPATWQGSSMLAAGRSGRVYFSAPWSDFLFGYRDGDIKVLVNATKNTTEVYNLADDPREQTNLAQQRPDLVTAGHQRMAAWVQYHDQYMKRLLGE